jgi:superfamily I DNA/RNA helicase/RecB family exonuclease
MWSAAQTGMAPFPGPGPGVRWRPLSVASVAGSADASVSVSEGCRTVEGMPQITFTAPERPRSPLLSVDAAGRLAVDLAALDPVQRRVVAASAERSLRVLGGPGCGRTTALAGCVLHALAHGFAPEELLVIAPSRQAASRLAELVDAGVTRVSDGAIVRTAASLAFEVLGLDAAERDEPAPRLLTGAEQDRLLAELIAGHDEPGAPAGPGPRWPEQIGPEVRGLRGFRTELRELLGRADEHGVSPERLAALGRETGHPEWTAAGGLFAEYRDVRQAVEETAWALDSSELVVAAARTLERRMPPAMARVRMVLVDDAQEATVALAALLRPIVARGALLHVFGDPDQGTNGFRGGRADLVARLHAETGVTAEEVVLDRSHRLHGPIARVVSAVSRRIGTAGAGAQRRAVAAAGRPVEESARGEGADAPVAHPTDAVATVALSRAFASPADELGAVADLLRRRHLEDGVAWADMAVITRSSAGHDGLARDLAAAGVPVTVPGAQRAARDDAAAFDLLRETALGCGALELTGDLAVELLTGPLGGVDRLRLRRLRRALRERVLADGGTRHGDDLLVDAIAQGTGLPPAGPLAGDIRAVDRLHGVLQHIRDQHMEGAPAVDLLWTAWEGAVVAEAWRAQALGDGVTAVEANRHLDAVVALFTAAQRQAERMPEADAADFLRQQLDQAVPEDTLARQGRRDAVLVAAPAGTLGLEFDTVAVMGLQDGAWPNTRQRDTLLGSERLVETITGAGDVDRRRAVIDDELRMFVQAASRARARLLLTTVVDEDDAPSVITRMLEECAPLEEVPSARTMHRYTLRGLGGGLRRRLHRDPDDVHAARALAVLAASGVPGAAVGEWGGLAPTTTDAPLAVLAPADDAPITAVPGAVEDPTGLMRVSPSALQRFRDDPLAWFLGRIGVDAGSVATGIGTLLHAAFEHAEREHSRDLARMTAEVRARWGELDFASRWQSRLELADVEVRLGRMRDYLLHADADGRRAVALEAPFAARVGVADLRGAIDRIERTPAGDWRVVDLKTGAPISAAEGREHPQLLAYQVAVRCGGVESLDAGRVDEAALVYVGGKSVSFTQRLQPGLDEAGMARACAEIDQAARGMVGPDFPAAPDGTTSPSGAPTQTLIHTVGEITGPAGVRSADEAPTAAGAPDDARMRVER